jgi:hypothetical protein
MMDMHALMILPGQPELSAATRAAVDEESRRIRRLQIVVRLALGIIAEGSLPYEEAIELAGATRNVALTLFPESGETFDLLYRPKFQRLIREVYRVQ